VKLGYWGVVRALTATGIVMGSLLGAAAQQPTPEQISAIRSSCRSDFMAHCTGVAPGTREALECLKHNAAKVSPSCRTALDAVRPPSAESAAPAHAKPAPAPAPAATEAPPAAAEAPPPPAEAGGPPPAEGQPEAPPPGAPAEGHKHHHSPQVAAIRAACRSDFGVHCPGVRLGGSAALHCLQANAAALSPPCREAVVAMGEGGTP
jgi:hypothetical protein